ncbi:MAG TPA: hypothetical protein VIQ29_25310 [Ancylobacter sp.]
MLRSTISTLASFLVFLIVHFLTFHFLAPNDKVNFLLATAAAGLVLFFILLSVLPSEEWFREKLHVSDRAMKRVLFPALGAFFYALLFLGYLEFYFTADRSITFRMLIITSEQPGQEITQAKLLELYDIQSIVVRRIDDLTYGGYFDREKDRYRLTTKARIVLQIYKFTIDFLHLGKF